MSPTVETGFFLQNYFAAIVIGGCLLFSFALLVAGVMQCRSTTKLVRQTQEEQVEVAIATIEEGIVVKGIGDDKEGSKKKGGDVYYSDVQAVLLT